MPERKRNRTEERSYAELDLLLLDLDMQLAMWKRKEAFIPGDWHRVERDAPVRRRKTRVTAALDADLVKWFRAMGHGYQARMNLVLRTFMAAVISKEIRFRADENWKGELI